jgi:hypothetical protein
MPLAADVQLSAEPVVSRPHELFRIRLIFDGERTYGVSPDARRFIAIQDLNTVPASVVVVERWLDELAKVLPGN